MTTAATSASETPSVSQDSVTSNSVSTNSMSQTMMTDEMDLDALSAVLHEQVFESFDDGLYIGIMSGTSLDGMDAVLCRFHDTQQHDSQNSHINQTMTLVATHSQDFAEPLHHILLALCQPNGIHHIDHDLSYADVTDSHAMSELDWYGWAGREYAKFASDVVKALLSKTDTPSEDVLAIGCHGQTVRHRPQLGFSLQIVDPNLLAEATGISVVSDFRRRDMAVSGQGAPLACAFHQAMFAQDSQTSIILNLGGIANITVLPAKDSGAQPLGYDTCPANLLLDAWIQRHQEVDYDADGQWARSGRVAPELLDKLLAHAYFALPAPKSTGREDFHLNWLDAQLETFAKTHPHINLSAADIQATLTELTAVSVSQQAIKEARNASTHNVSTHNVTTRNVSSHTANTDAAPEARLYACGGGALNGYLLERLQHYLPNWMVAGTDTVGIAPIWVEAAAFAWLARQTLMGETGNLPAVTGADKTVVLGQVCFA